MDKKYWEEFYKTQNEELKPSLFARYVYENLCKPTFRLIELGCGNGRDAIFFANEGLQVYAVDQCESEIKFLSNRYRLLNNCVFVSDDFTAMSDSDTQYDIVYSRFTLHSVSKEQEQNTLEWSHRNLTHDGYLCIEVHGKKNEIFQHGEKVEGEKDAYILNNHYRRFLDFQTLCTDLENLGFLLTFAAEEKGFAPFAEMDETYIRVIALKK